MTCVISAEPNDISNDEPPIFRFRHFLFSMSGSPPFCERHFQTSHQFTVRRRADIFSHGFNTLSPRIIWWGSAMINEAMTLYLQAKLPLANAGFHLRTFRTKRRQLAECELAGNTLEWEPSSGREWEPNMCTRDPLNINCFKQWDLVRTPMLTPLFLSHKTAWKTNEVEPTKLNTIRIWYRFCMANEDQFQL